MRKIYVLLSFIFCVFTLSSQTVRTLNPSISKSLTFYNFKLYPLDKNPSIDDENQYVFRNNFDEFLLYTIDKNGKVKTSPTVKVPKNHYWQGCYQTTDKIVSIYGSNDDETVNCYINVCDKNKMTWNPELLASFICHKKDNCYSKVSVSPNQTHFCFVALTADKKSNFQGMNVMVFDAEGQKVWENMVSPDFSNKTFNISDVAITDEGVVYISTPAYSGEKKKIYDEKIYLLEIKENDFKQVESNQNIGYISSAEIKLLKNGNVFIGGYYSEKKDDLLKGTFSLMYNTKEQYISTFTQREFPNYFSKNDVSSLNLDQIFELSNGQIYVLGEQLMTIVYRSQSGSSYKSFAKNIVYTSIDNNGNIENHEIIKKNQNFNSFIYIADFRQICLSYYAFEKDGALCLLFNDHNSNINSTKKTTPLINPVRSKKKNIVRLVKIDGSNLSNQIIMDGKLFKKSMHTFLFNEDNGLIVANLGKTVSIDKISITIK